MDKRFLYIFRTGPYSTAGGQEGLDAILAASALEVEITVLFVEDAVFLIKSGQQADQHGVKQYTKAFAALVDLGVHAVFVDGISMHARGLEESDLMITAHFLEGGAISDLLSEQDRVFTF